jgi:uncharacterized iron-regulated membrane protein
MTWLHTWFGLVLGYVLMACFFFGSLSVFDREFDRWAIPDARFAPQVMPSYDTMLKPIFEQITPDEDGLKLARERVGGPLPEVLKPVTYSAYTTHRDPILDLYTAFDIKNPKDPHDVVFGHLTIDPRDGKVLPHDQLKIGSEFFYPMHYSLTLEWKEIGYWIVGLAALAMLAALVSGVVMHRKIFREMFTFRPKKKLRRSVLDLHNLTGVVALPFHFVFALSGLIIFAGTYFPVSETMLRSMHDKHEVVEAAELNLPHDAAGIPAKLASVDAMVAEAKRRWAARDMPGDVGFLVVSHLGDVNSYVSIYRAGKDQVTQVGQGIHFAGPTGEVLHEDPAPTAVSGVMDFLTGLHLQHFEHWLLRWFYVLGGLSGCVCIATGFLFFVEKRKRQHAAQGSSIVRWADALAVASVTGMVAAACAILVVNRALPEGLAARGDWEKAIFWMSWLAMLGHATWRSAPVAQARISPAWREQCYVIAALAVSAAVLNWTSTGDHLIKTIGGGDWAIAGVDLSLLGAALLSIFAARHLAKRERNAPSEQKVDHVQPLQEEPAHG